MFSGIDEIWWFELLLLVSWLMVMMATGFSCCMAASNIFPDQFFSSSEFPSPEETIGILH